MSENPILAPGVRVVVVQCDALNFDDYDVGDTAVITSIKEVVPGYTIVRVRWDKPRFTDSSKERARCDSLYTTEIEPI